LSFTFFICFSNTGAFNKKDRENEISNKLKTDFLNLIFEKKIKIPAATAKAKKALLELAISKEKPKNAIKSPPNK
jgi:hypothetical protein